MSRKKSAILQVLLDASGSMASKYNDTIGGFNEYMASLKAAPLSYKINVLSFDTSVKNIFKDAKYTEARLSKENYTIGGNTALFDALGHAMDDVADDKKTPILVVVFTDGEENSSREYSKAAILAKIKQKTEQGNWTFAYMGSDPSTWDAASGIGIAKGSTMSFDPNDPKAAYRALAACTQSYSTAHSAGQAPSADAFFDNPSFPSHK